MINIEIMKSIKLIAFDFDGVFTDNKVIFSEKGIESVTCYRSDGIGLSRLKELGIKLVILSSETNPVVSLRSKKLKIQCFQSLNDKSKVLFKLSKKYNIKPKNIMYVGNDINDISAFKFVGIPVGVADSYPEIESFVLFKTKKKGGEGAVREICDLVYSVIKKDTSSED